MFSVTACVKSGPAVITALFIGHMELYVDDVVDYETWRWSLATLSDYQYLHVHAVFCGTLHMVHTDPHSKLRAGMVTSQPQCRIKCKDNLPVMNC
jgi:hypothetical protein